jgi:hypothetical protein
MSGIVVAQVTGGELGAGAANARGAVLVPERERGERPHPAIGAVEEHGALVVAQQPAAGERRTAGHPSRLPATRIGENGRVITCLLHRCGLRAWELQILSLGSVGLCIGLWIRAKTVDQDERGNAERRAIFVGLWPPTIWLIGDSLARHE